MTASIKQLRDEIALLHLILDNSFGNVFVTDGEGRILYVNENAASAFNVPREVLLSMTIYEMVEKRMANQAASIDVIETKKKSVRAVTLQNGVTLAVSAEPIFDEAGALKYVVVFSQNKLIVDEFMQEVQQENQMIRQTLSHVLNDEYKKDDIIVNSDKIRECLAMATRAAGLDSTILLQGESGVGKEVVSRFVHDHSPRKTKLFIPVNCAAIPRELMESEFFGYESGAFTGSSREGKAGLFQLADQGTLFLDEIGELDLAMQSKLLRVLESGEIRRVGGTKYQKIDVRIISATNRDLKKMVAEGTFREDLYYRLSVIPILVPPLRERKEDIEGLALYFLEKLNKKYLRTKQFTESALSALADYDWPGNVRELRNVVERVFVVTSENVISANQVGNILGGNHREKLEITDIQHRMSFLERGKSLRDATDAFQRQLILETLKQNEGNVETAAKVLGMGRSGLYKKMDKLGLKRQF